MAKPILNQVSIGAMIGDAITDQAFLIRRWLRERGFQSEIYAEGIHPLLEKEVRPFFEYRPAPSEKHLILHHSIGSPVVDHLLSLPLEFIMVYHNITPPQFFEGIDPAITEQLRQGRRQLQALASRTPVALAASAYNELELKEAGFAATGVLPITLDESKYEAPSEEWFVEHLRGVAPILLFVGRQVPNKKPEDLIKLLYYYHRVDPGAHLLLCGDCWIPSYDHWLRDMARDLNLHNHIHFLGHVTQERMVTCYRLADLYVSMSEHEGFGKPLIESMYMNVPVLAYAAAGVPYTLGGAGVLFKEKKYEVVAEMADLLIKDRSLRTTILAGQKRRLNEFLEPQVKTRLYEAIEKLA